MAKIALSDTTYTVVPEGTHIFKITAVTYKVDFGKLEITMKTEQGLTHIERFSFIKSNGEKNDVAVGIFSFLAKTALQDFDREEIDHTELVGCYIKCEVTHDVVPNKNDPTKSMTFSRLGNKYPANGYDDDGEQPEPKAAPSTKKTVDLSKILGRR